MVGGKTACESFMENIDHAETCLPKDRRTEIIAPVVGFRCKNCRAEYRSGLLSGADLIANERQRQLDKEGWTPEHDDKHTELELTRAAVAYCMAKIKKRDFGYKR